MRRWRGLKALIQDGVEHGSRAVEKVHMAIAARPFTVLEAIPPLAAPARVVHTVHDAVTKGVYVSIRAVNQVAGATLDAVMDVVEEEQAKAPAPAPEEKKDPGASPPQAG